MLHILLTLLKIIGIILLVILGILVLSVCVVLFAPFRYHGKASVSGSVESIKAHVKLSWFLHLISGYAIYEENKLDWQVRILWRKLNKEKQKLPEELKEEEPKEETTKEEATKKSIKKTAPKKKKQNIFEKIKYTFRTICDKIKLLIKKKEKLQEFLVDEIHRSAWKSLIQEIVRLLRFIKPKNLILNLHFGFEDPALTGKLLAILSMLYPFYQDHINIEPEFEEQILEGNAFIKGHIRSLHLLIVFWNLFFDKNIKATYNEIQKWER